MRGWACGCHFIRLTLLAFVSGVSQQESLHALPFHSWGLKDLVGGGRGQMLCSLMCRPGGGEAQWWHHCLLHVFSARSWKKSRIWNCLGGAFFTQYKISFCMLGMVPNHAILVGTTQTLEPPKQLDHTMQGNCISLLSVSIFSSLEPTAKDPHSYV